MLYLDYSATTPVDPRVMDAFAKAAESFGNYNSSHDIGLKTKAMLDTAVQSCCRSLEAEEFELIYTSGASESNNLAIKGYCAAKGKGRIITTWFEHSSVVAPISYLQKKGFGVDFVRTKPNGEIDLEHLKSLLSQETVLVCLSLVSSELGYVQPLADVRWLLIEFPNIALHVDATQAVGKADTDFSSADTVSISAHKFYGFKGIGILLKKKGIRLEKQICGGHSITDYRSGTPANELIVSMAKALELAKNEGRIRNEKVKSLRKKLEGGLADMPDYCLNNPGSVPHIANISLPGRSSKNIQEYLSRQGVCVSGGSACSAGEHSIAVLKHTGEYLKAKSSFRVSLSHLTTEEEISTLLTALHLLRSEVGL